MGLEIALTTPTERARAMQTAMRQSKDRPPRTGKLREAYELGYTESTIPVGAQFGELLVTGACERRRSASGRLHYNRITVCVRERHSGIHASEPHYEPARFSRIAARKNT